MRTPKVRMTRSCKKTTPVQDRQRLYFLFLCQSFNLETDFERKEVETHSGIITPSAAPMSNPVLKVDSFAK